MPLSPLIKRGLHLLIVGCYLRVGFISNGVDLQMDLRGQVGELNYQGHSSLSTNVETNSFAMLQQESLLPPHLVPKEIIKD